LQDLAGYSGMRAACGVWIREVSDTRFADVGMEPRLHPLSTTSPRPLPGILRDNQTLMVAPASLGRHLCRCGLAVALDVQLTTPNGEIGGLCAVDAIDKPLHAEFIAALRAA
jgi:hypothetical protein